MIEQLEHALRSWLSHERAGRERRAERALARVFSLLPGEAPAAGFADRVLAASGYAFGGRRSRDLVGTRKRLAVAACWVLAAVSLSFLPSLIAAAAAMASSGQLLDLGAALLNGAVRRLAEAVAAWDTLSGVGKTVGSATATPFMLTLMSFSALLSLGALRLLQGLLVTGRRTRHVA